MSARAHAAPANKPATRPVASGPGREPPRSSSPLAVDVRPDSGALRFGQDFSAVPAHVVAAQGVGGAGGAFPHHAAIERSFGRHRLGGARALIGGPAAKAAQALGAAAYTLGETVAFARAPDLSTAAHEAAHVIQQRAGVNLPRGLDARGDRYENQADKVAALVTQGRSAESLLDQTAGPGGAHRVVQRLAFVNETQIKTPAKDFTAPMKSMVTDAPVRNYTGADEFKRHADKQTDYLGNMADGTWLRFDPAGTNLLGENHTEVTLEQVLPAVNSRKFIYEPFSTDNMAAGTAFRSAYDTEAQDRYKRFGIDKEPDKRQFGEESLLAKMGYNLEWLTAYFEKDPAHPLSDLTSGGYDGQPGQRYLKIAWGWSKDNKADVAAKQKAGQGVPPKFAKLATVHAKVEGQLDKFITALKVDGFLGDELVKKGNDVLLAPLAEFARAFTEAMVRVAAADSGSRMSMGERSSHSGSGVTTEKDKEKIFTDWRNFNFQDNVNAATKRGVRYAGMGEKHLEFLVNAGLAKDQHPFDMRGTGKELKEFKAETDKLKKAAKSP